jgi:hypothetical protein
MLIGVATFADFIRFEQDDPDEVVRASLACPFCLVGNEVESEFRSGGYDPCIECVCPSCPQNWRVFMTPHQALRLGLMDMRAT